MNDNKRNNRTRYRFRFYWRRWVIMLILSLIVIVVQVVAHRRMHIAHNTGLTIWDDQEFVQELIFFGLMVPVSGGILLTFLERTSSERDEVTRELVTRRELIKEINGLAHWDQLTNYVVQLPGRIAPALASQLLVHDPVSHRLKTAAIWPAPDYMIGPLQVTFDDCQQCPAAAKDRPALDLRCPADVSSSGVQTTYEYCLPLISSEDSRAILRFYLPATQALADSQVRLLSDLAPELALSIENMLLLRFKEAQDELAVKERHRIARNLHDTLGQNISFLRLKLDQLSSETMLSKIVEISREIERMREVANESYEQVRETLAELHPSSDADLITSLRQHAGTVSERAGFAVEWQVEGQERLLKPTVRRNIAFIVREALNNVEKHARAERVRMSLQWHEKDLLLTVADDGLGYQPGQTDGDDHYGIGIMQERAEAVDGQLTIESVLSQGTEVRLCLPLPGNIL